MPRRSIPISKKQHDSINATVAAMKDAQNALALAGNVILMGLEEDIPRAGIVGAECVDGVYHLVIELPDIAPPVQVSEAQSA